MAFRSGVSRSLRLFQLSVRGSQTATVTARRWYCRAEDEHEHPHKDKKLFTPGPLGVSYETKKAMLRDFGSRDTAFMNCVKQIRQKLVEIAGVSPSDYSAIPVQGSGTYSVEAVLTSTTPRDGKVLIIEGGAYGKRMGKICEVAGIDYVMLSGPENAKTDLNEVERILKEDSSFTNVAMVHCETTSGVINPVVEVGRLVKQLLPNATFFVDAMSSFGAVPLNFAEGSVDYMVSSANKCIEGVPGFSFVIARTNHLLKCEGFARSLSLDIVDQYKTLEKTGQFRFTPPTHTMLAFRKAISELEAEGGVIGRAERYIENRQILRDGMKKLGFRELLDDTHEGYIITSYHFPKHPNYNFSEFYKRLNDKNQVIYPGKVTNADCFRIGNIGHLFPKDMEHLLVCIEEVMKSMELPIPLLD